MLLLKLLSSPKPASNFLLQIRLYIVEIEQVICGYPKPCVMSSRILEKLVGI